jgi:hypothetical protein
VVFANPKEPTPLISDEAHSTHVYRAHNDRHRHWNRTRLRNADHRHASTSAYSNRSHVAQRSDAPVQAGRVEYSTVPSTLLRCRLLGTSATRRQSSSNHRPRTENEGLGGVERSLDAGVPLLRRVSSPDVREEVAEKVLIKNEESPCEMACKTIRAAPLDSKR